MATLDASKSLNEGQKVAVPKELLPYLKKIRTEDYLGVFDKNSEKKGLAQYAATVLAIPGFDIFMGLVIIVNMGVMIIEIDATADGEGDASGTAAWTEPFGWVVLFIFIVELSARMIAYKLRFWRDRWNIFDFAIVVTDAAFSLAGIIGGQNFPVSILRIFRLAKLARVFKVLRVFPQLRLLVAGLLSSISAIFWGTILLFLGMLVWALIAVLFIHPLNRKISYDGCDRCSRAYSSVMNATLTFWQTIVTGDSWGMATIPLIEKHPITALFFVMVYLSVGMAVLNLILGVVVNVAQQAQDALKDHDATEKALHKLKEKTSLIGICKQMDSDDSGLLSQEEVYAAFEEPGEFRDSVMALDITREEFDIVWTILDTHRNGFVSYKELVSTLFTLKTSDIQYQLSYIKYYITELRHMMEGKIDDHHDKLAGHHENLKGHVEEALAEHHDKLKDQIDSKDAGEDVEIDGPKDPALLKKYTVLLEQTQAIVRALQVVNNTDEEDQYVVAAGDPSLPQESNAGDASLPQKGNVSQGADTKSIQETPTDAAKQCSPITSTAKTSDGWHYGTVGDSKVDVFYNEISACLNQELQPWLKRIDMLRVDMLRVFREMALLRVELKDSLTDTNRPDLLVVPAKTSTCSLFPLASHMWCETGEVFEDKLHQELYNVPAKDSSSGIQPRQLPKLQDAAKAE